VEQRERHRKWVEANREKAREHARNWYHRHKSEVQKKRNREWYLAHREATLRRQQLPEVKARRKELYRANAAKIRAKVRARAATPEGKAYAREYQRRRRKENFNVHFMNWLRGSINRCLREQGQKRFARSHQYIGCTPAELVIHLQSQFQPGMSWSVPRDWDVDHIIAASKFNLADHEEAMWAFNYRNLRPMDRLANKIKSDTLPTPLPAWLPLHIANRITARNTV
jgi:hypothetical protein